MWTDGHTARRDACPTTSRREVLRTIGRFAVAGLLAAGGVWLGARRPTEGRQVLAACDGCRLRSRCPVEGRDLDRRAAPHCPERIEEDRRDG